MEEPLARVAAKLGSSLLLRGTVGDGRADRPDACGGRIVVSGRRSARGRENGGIRRVGGGVDDQRCADGGTGLQPRYHALMKLLAGSCRRELLRQRLDLME